MFRAKTIAKAVARATASDILVNIDKESGRLNHLCPLDTSLLHNILLQPGFNGSGEFTYVSGRNKVRFSSMEQALVVLPPRDASIHSRMRMAARLSTLTMRTYVVNNDRPLLDRMGLGDEISIYAWDHLHTYHSAWYVREWFAHLEEFVIAYIGARSRSQLKDYVP